MGEFVFDYETPLDRYIQEAFVLRSLDPEFVRACEAMLARQLIRWRDPVPTEDSTMPATPPAEGYL